MMKVICAILVIAFSAIACQNQTQVDVNAIAHPVHVDPLMARRLESDVLQMRQQKDEYFKTNGDSPLPAEIRVAFQGLEYYPFNWKYRFEGPVHRYPNPEQFKMITTEGDSRDAMKYGFIKFRIDGKEFKLEVYKLLDSREKDLLFVPFVDANVGTETYPAGRYIDLQEKPNGMYIIDFNTAYNPSCAYGGNFPCPVTPKENHLSVPIPAGEKNLSLAAKLEEKKKRSEG